MPEPISMGAALVGAGGGLLGGLAQMFGQRAMQREQMRREAEMRKGEQLAQIYGQEGQAKSQSLANLIDAYRSALS